MSSYENAGKPRNPLYRPPLQSPRLLGQVRERLRYLHYSLRTEQNYVYWARFFIHFSGLKHPRDLGKAQVEAFLTMLATERKVSVPPTARRSARRCFSTRKYWARSCPGCRRSAGPQRRAAYRPC
jgi:hypothetical protein